MLSPDYTAFANGNEPRLGVRPATVFKQIDRLSVRRLFRIVACIGSNCRRLKSAGRSPEYTGDVWRLESPTNRCRIPRTSQGTELRCAPSRVFRIISGSESSAVQNHQRFRIISGSESSAIQNHQRCGSLSWRLLPCERCVETFSIATIQLCSRILTACSEQLQKRFI